MSTSRIYLNAFDMACVGHQSAGLWRHPDDQGYRYRELGYWTELARCPGSRRLRRAVPCRRARRLRRVRRLARRRRCLDAAQFPVNDPTLAVSAMAAVTETLGFGITPVADLRAALRAGAQARRRWITSPAAGWRGTSSRSYLDSAARNLGLDAQIPHDQRYEIAEEYLEVCYKLWEASVGVRRRGARRTRECSPTRQRCTTSSTRGVISRCPAPFLCEPSPQRTPVLFQAGASPRGVRFAAAHAEAVFVSRPTPQVVRWSGAGPAGGRCRAGPRPSLYQGLHDGHPGRRRDPSSRPSPSLPNTASSSAPQALWPSSAAGPAWTWPSSATTIRCATARPTPTGPRWRRPTTGERTWTARELAEEIGIGGRGPVLVGSPTEVADELERWVDEADVDGFDLAYVTTPGTFVDFARLVVPELRRRGRVPRASSRAPRCANASGGAGPLLPTTARRGSGGADCPTPHSRRRGARRRRARARPLASPRTRTGRGGPARRARRGPQPSTGSLSPSRTPRAAHMVDHPEAGAPDDRRVGHVVRSGARRTSRPSTRRAPSPSRRRSRRRRGWAPAAWTPRRSAPACRRERWRRSWRRWRCGYRTGSGS